MKTAPAADYGVASPTNMQAATIRALVRFAAHRGAGELNLRQLIVLLTLPPSATALTDRATVTDLSHVLSTSKTVVSHIIGKLTAAGLISRTRDDVDWRRVWLCRTTKGDTIVADMFLPGPAVIAKRPPPKGLADATARRSTKRTTTAPLMKMARKKSRTVPEEI